MKKSFFTIASLAMVLALVGCSGNQKPSGQTSGSGSGSQSASSTGSESSQGGEVEVPVTEGKLTVYFTADFDGVELADYAAINLAGGFTTWDTGNPELSEMTKLEGTNVFYKQVTAPAAGTIYYKIILGYNTASQYPDDQLGINWTNEATGYPTGDEFGPGEHNKTIEFAGTEQKVDLGSYTWNTMLPQPVLNYHNATMYVDFYEEIPAGHHVYIMGGFNSWSATEMTKDTTAEGVRYQTTFEHLLEKEYEFKIKVHPTAKDAEGFDVWSGGFEVNTANAKVAVNALFDRGARNVYGTDVKRFPGNQLDEAMKAANNAEVSFVGVVGAMFDTQGKTFIVADRDNAIMVYSGTAVEGIKVGDTVAVDGKISIYHNNGQDSDTREVVKGTAETLIEKVADHGQSINYADVTKALIENLHKKDETVGEVDYASDLNKLVKLEGKVTANDVVMSGENVQKVTMTVEVVAAEGENPAVTFTVYAEAAKNAAAAAAMATYEVGDTVSVKGALGYYNGFQITAPQLEAKAAA